MSTMLVLSSVLGVSVGFDLEPSSYVSERFFFFLSVVAVVVVQKIVSEGTNME